ncbi:MAG: hypothetical protein AB3N14_06590 [Flavobacteriaceae bacterium]
MRKFLFLFAFIIAVSCDLNTGVDESDCSAVLCAADVSTLHLVVLDKGSGENVFVNGRYTIDDVMVTDGAEKEIPFALSEVFSNNTTTLVLMDPEWKIGSFIYSITLGEEIEFKVAAELDRDNNTGCCANRLFVSEVEVIGISHEIQKVPQIATIFLE